jgi:hypothetical protein
VRSCHSSCLKRAGLVLCLGILGQLSIPLRSAGQCGNTFSTRTFDTLIATNTGYGNFRLAFPQWHPDSGTLVSVKVQALVTLKYGFTLVNMDVIPSVYTLRVGREDKITSPAMATYDNILDQHIGDYPLDPGHSVSMPPFSFMDKYPNIDSITTATAPFIGFDSVHFVYAPVTYTNLRADNNASYNYRATARDTVLFSITYLHCGPTTLATSLSRFTAALERPASVKLSWTIQNERPGRGYLIQQSRDGQGFTDLDSLPSTGGNGNAADYEYTYDLPGGSVPGKWYFRLKMNDGHGGYSYSDIKELTAGMPVAGGLLLYPNPAAGFVNILFGGSVAGDWQVDIFNAGGDLVQSDHFLHTRSAQVDFRHILGAGTYFIRATERHTQKIAVSPLLVLQ